MKLRNINTGFIIEIPKEVFKLMKHHSNCPYEEVDTTPIPIEVISFIKENDKIEQPIIEEKEVEEIKQEQIIKIEPIIEEKKIIAPIKNIKKMGRPKTKK